MTSYNRPSRYSGFRPATPANTGVDSDGVTARDWARYKRGEQRLRDQMNSRPILNPDGPRPLVPALSLEERRAINQRHIEQRFAKG